MIKSSNHYAMLKESRRRWKCGSKAFGEWTYEGNRKPYGE